MLKYLDVLLLNRLAFVDNPNTAFDRYPDLLPEFLSLHKNDIRGRATANDYRGFARKNGALGKPERAVLAAEADSFECDMATELDDSDHSIYIESFDLWRYHVDAMRDIGMVHMLLNSEAARTRVDGVRVVRDNCLVFSDEESGKTMCLYHGTGGTADWRGEPESGYGRDLPTDVRSHLALYGNPFYYADELSDEDKGSWLFSHLSSILEDYCRVYFSSESGMPGTLLEYLQAELKKRISQEGEFLVFCLLCGGVASGNFESGSQALDTNTCRVAFYRAQDLLVETIAEHGLYTEDEAKELLRIARKKYRKKSE